MTQFKELVERQRALLKAEQWGSEIKSVHTHRLKSCWYDDRPEDTERGYVTDFEYNNGKIERQQNEKIIHTWWEYEKSAEQILEDM